MKILFYYRESESVGIEYLMSVLKQTGHEVGLLFDRGISYGMIGTDFQKKLVFKEALLEQAKKFDPDLLAFSSDYYLYPHVRDMAKYLKNNINVPSILGGIQAASMPDTVLNEAFIDMICVGEGEDAIVELAEKMEQGKKINNIENIWIKKNGHIEKSEVRPLIADLDKLPYPDRALFFKNKAFQNSLMVISSRGCPYKCAFCHNPAEQDYYKKSGKYLRRRSVDNVLNEIKECMDKFPIKRVEFEDEIFNLNKKWFNEFCEKYMKEIKLPFWCQLRADSVTEDTVEKLKQAGCEEVFVGVESGNDRIRNQVLKKQLSSKSIITAASLIKKYGIRLQITGMFGTPGETDKEMIDTVNLIEKIKPDSVPTYTLFPFPKTPILTYAVETGYMDANRYNEILKSHNGIGQTHGVSVLNHPYSPLAYNISKLLSLYLLTPKILRPLFKTIFFKNHTIWGVNFIYNLFLIKNYRFHSKERLKIFFNSLWVCLRSVNKS